MWLWGVVWGCFRWGRYDVWAVGRKQLAVDDCYADTEYEFTQRSARYEEGTSCQTLERRQLPRSTRYHVQGELENVRQFNYYSRRMKLTFLLLD